MPDTYYPPSGFSFQVSIVTSGLSPAASVDMIFEEVSGIETAMQHEEESEGGENSFVHRLPVLQKPPNLVLKRGLARASSPLCAWATESLSESLAAAPGTKTLSVTLVNASALPLATWIFHGAWPVKWEVSSLNGKGNDIAIESLECAYSSRERRVPGA